MPAIRTLFATVAALLVAPALAAAAPAVDGEFALTGKPVHLAPGPDGNMWVAMSDSTRGNDVAEVTPAGAVTEFDLPGVTDAAGIATGPDGKLWATHSIGGGGVFRFLPADPLGGADVPVSDITNARSIVVGSDGNLWTASGDKAIRITPAAVPVATPFTVTGMAANDIVRGGDGLLYIAEGGSGVGHVVGLTTDGRATFYETGGGQGVAAGPGNQIAYTNPVVASPPEQIGRITPGTLRPLVTDVPSVDPTGIAFGSDGVYWIANFGDNSLSRFTTDGALTSFPGLSALSGPRWIAAGPNDTLWVGLETARRVARVTGVSAPVVTPPGGGGGGTTPPGGGSGGTNPPADRTPPVASKLFLPKRLHPGQHADVDVTLSEAATLTLRFTRVLPGKRTSAGRCVRPARSLRRRPACTRAAKVGTLTRRAGSGAVTLSWDGKVAGHKLAVGSYRLAIGALDAAGNRSASPVQTGFKVVRPARSRRPRAHR